VITPIVGLVAPLKTLRHQVAMFVRLGAQGLVMLIMLVDLILILERKKSCTAKTWRGKYTWRDLGSGRLEGG
jgi:hypothetical protein